MSIVESIERSVANLAPGELAEFRRWFAEFDAAAWDAQIEADAATGKFDALAAAAFLYFTGPETESSKLVTPVAVHLVPGAGPAQVGLTLQGGF